MENENENVETEERVCSCCGRVIEEGEEFEEINGEIYCESCFSDEFTTCEDCGEIIRRDDAIWVNGGDYCICESCYEDNYFTCDDCGEVYHNDDGTYVSGGNHVCDSCRDNDYYYCEECEEWVYYEDWNSDYDCCCNCAEENHRNVIAGYHDSSKDFTLYDKGENPKWYIGYELETGNRDTSSYEGEIAEFLHDRLNVEFERDSSISACSDVEIISQPQSLQYIYGIKDKMKECFEYMTQKGYKSHDLGTCGLHFHFTRQHDIDNDEVIARGWLILETFKDQIIRISGRKIDGDTYYYKWLSDSTNNYGESIKAISKLKKNGETNSTRYLAINNQNDETIEFRFNRGTLNFNTFMARVEFSNNLYEIMTNVNKNIEEYSWQDLIKGEYISQYAKELGLDNVNIPIKDYSIDIIQKENELRDKIKKAIKVYTTETQKRIREISPEKIIVKNYREMLDNMQSTFFNTKYYLGIIKTLDNILNSEETPKISEIRYYVNDTGFDNDTIKKKVYKIFNDFEI